MKRRWTAHCTVRVGSGDIHLAAQCKSSRAELERRIVADDSCWSKRTLKLEKAWDKKHFRRGLSFRVMNP